MILILNNNEIFFIKKKISINQLISKINKFKNFKFICFNINNLLCDLNFIILKSSSIYIIKLDNKKARNVIRHSCAHLLAHALKNIYKDIKLSIGPVIKYGFYYDFFLKKKITYLDLPIIEKEMKYLSNCNIDILRFKVKINTIKNLFCDNKYKLDIINKINKFEMIYYKQENFIDLCLGPHVCNTKYLKYFKLLNISGAYWKNNKKNEMLYRIYGTAWESEKQIKNYLINLEKLKENDHKKIGKQLNLFNFYNYAPGVVFWNKQGWNIYLNIIKYIRSIMNKNKYFEINTPIMLNSFLFEQSGHISKFNKYIFKYKNNKNNSFILKPMNCPCHINIFKHFNKKSYKDLPLRLSEFGVCFRNELSGTLFGLMRLKNFVQDDGHIFCTEINMQNEIKKFIYLLKKIYYKFNFKIFKVVLSKQPKNINNNYDIWKKAENILETVIKDLKFKYSISYDGAFYGPKLEFLLKDNINRIWQCGTIQVDFFTAKKLNTYYINEKGYSETPIILHRVILGSIERFFGILLENKNGVLPFWITPIQIEILYINDLDLDYAKNVYNFMKLKYKVKLCINNERLEYKIKKCILEKIPYIIVLGKKEREKKIISIREFGSQLIKHMSLNKFINDLKLKNF